MEIYFGNKTYLLNENILFELEYEAKDLPTQKPASFKDAMKQIVSDSKLLDKFLNKLKEDIGKQAEQNKETTNNVDNTQSIKLSDNTNKALQAAAENIIKQMNG